MTRNRSRGRWLSVHRAWEPLDAPARLHPNPCLMAPTTPRALTAHVPTCSPGSVLPALLVQVSSWQPTCRFLPLGFLTPLYCPYNVPVTTGNDRDGMQLEPTPGAEGRQRVPRSLGQTPRRCESFALRCPSAFLPTHTEQTDASSLSFYLMIFVGF